MTTIVVVSVLKYCVTRIANNRNIICYNDLTSRYSKNRNIGIKKILLCVLRVRRSSVNRHTDLCVYSRVYSSM